MCVSESENFEGREYRVLADIEEIRENTDNES